MNDFPFRSHFLDVDGRRVHYVDEGRGHTVVFFHGNPTWSYAWRRLIERLKPRYRVIAFDHLGCGLSDKPQDYDYRLSDHIRNARRLVDEVTEGPLTFVLHDWGGPIGLGCAAAFPDRVKRAVLLNTAAFSVGKLPWRLSLCRAPGLGAFAVRGLNGFARAATWMATEKGLAPETKRMFLLPYDSYANRIATHRFVQDIPLDEWHPSWSTLREVEASLASWRERPTALVWGGKDWVFHRGFFDEWRRRLPFAEAHWLESAGHYVMEDAADEVGALVDGFLARTDA